MEKIKITRVRNGKVQIFDRKVKETNYDGHLNIRLSSETKELLIIQDIKDKKTGQKECISKVMAYRNIIKFLKNINEKLEE